MDIGAISCLVYTRETMESLRGWYTVHDVRLTIVRPCLRFISVSIYIRREWSLEPPWTVMKVMLPECCDLLPEASEKRQHESRLTVFLKSWITEKLYSGSMDFASMDLCYSKNYVMYKSKTHFRFMASVSIIYKDFWPLYCLKRPTIVKPLRLFHVSHIFGWQKTISGTRRSRFVRVVIWWILFFLDTGFSTIHCLPRSSRIGWKLLSGKNGC